MSTRKPPNDLSRHLKDVLRAEQDRSLARRALSAGLLTEKELADFVDGGKAAGGREIEQALLAKGIAPEEIRQLRESIDREDFALFRADRRPPPEALAVQGEPGRRLAEFVLVTRLGQGGVGEVWKAWDTRLGRWTAIKRPMATPDQEAATRRFTREALAAARLSHPNIVSIHRVAEEDGHAFIVMQYVEGKSLAQRRPGLRESLELMRAVALAVHYAHEQGVIHRDLKPANIMIGPDGRPFVLDFGLAHLEEAARTQSREGIVSGTAAYMSPEQARGGPAARERGTDLYSLGATLYELATGRAPFQGATFAETLQQVLYRDPAPPRALNPQVPRAVEAVILKAMDKDPGRRYATAKDLADDLGRCLRGESTAAKPGALLPGLRRAVRAYPGLFLGAASVVLVIAVTAIYAGADARRTERLQREQRLREFRELAHVSLQAVLALRRAGANEQMGGFVARVEAAYEEAATVAPETAEVHYRMGRFCRALLNDGRAIALQEQALATDPAYVPALYERRVLALKEPKAPRAEKYLQGSREWLDVYADHDEVGRSRARVAWGLDLLRGGDRRQARKLFEEALASDPDIEEAWEALARTWLVGVTPHSPVRDQEEAHREAEEIYTKALTRDRGYLPFWIGRADVRAARAVLWGDTGREPDMDYQAALDDYSEAVRLRRSAEVLARRAALRTRIGLHRLRFGEDPTMTFAAAQEDLDHALRQSPRERAVLLQRAALALARAELHVSQGDSPLEEAQALEREAEPALNRDPSFATLWMYRGILWGYRAAHADGSSQDFERAETYFNEALRRDPDDPEIWERRGFVRVLKARRLLEAGQDPRADLADAETALKRALEAAFFFNQARLTRGITYRLRGAWQDRSGQDPTAAFTASGTDLAQALADDPLLTEAWVERGRLEDAWARYRTRRGDRGGARENFIQAVRSYEEAVRLNPQLDRALREPLREARRALLGSE